MNSEIRYVCVFAAGVITGAGVALEIRAIKSDNQGQKYNYDF